MTRSICIVGYAQETRELANNLPTSVELWGMNVNHKFMKRWDRWFQLHPPVWKGRPFYGRSLEHMEFLEKLDVPIYMRYPNPEFPTAVEYPLEQIYTDIGRRYLTSTVANMIGLALFENVDEIKVYGVNLGSNTEYIEQRPCIEWLLGLAEGRGIKVDVPDHAPMLKGNEYPGEFGDGPQEVAQARLDKKRQVYNKYWARVHNAAGAVEAIRMLQADGLSTEEVLRHWLDWGHDSAEHVNMMKGQIIESKFWLAHSGGFDRHASVMPLQHVPKGTFPPEIEQRLNGAVVKDEELEEAVVG
jgi:hypothetical protein